MGLHGCGFGCDYDEERSLELARKSAGNGSRYGQFTLGFLLQWDAAGDPHRRAQAAAFYRLAAAQGLDEAQCTLGDMYHQGEFNAKYDDPDEEEFIDDEDYAEGFRWYQLAAAQGNPETLFQVAECYAEGLGVAEDVAEAIRWYKRAEAAGHPNAAEEVQNLISDDDDDDDDDDDGGGGGGGGGGDDDDDDDDDDYDDDDFDDNDDDDDDDDDDT